MKVILTTLFGIEALTAAELEKLGYARSQIAVSDGQVRLDTGEGPDAMRAAAIAAARLNVNIRTAERVLIQLAEFPAQDFDTFFESSRALPWQEWIVPGAAFTVNGYSRKSALFGIPACQSLLKKAIVSRLQISRGLTPDSRLAEDPAIGLVRVQFGIVADQVSMMVDTSGDGLHKRGYRPLQHEAPIKETLAAAMIMVSRFEPFSDEALVDPCCGSGTIPIEAALMAFDIAPGLNRPFAGEHWPVIGAEPFRLAREEAMGKMDLTPPDLPFIFGSDLSPHAVDVAQSNARRAGVESLVRFRTADLTRLSPAELQRWTGHPRQLVICNPPYGERLLDLEQAEALYQSIGKIFLDRGMAASGIRLSVISPHEQFEKFAGGTADKRRKLYNGMIRCTLYHYYKQRRNAP
jgi:putative N6-adenine-specific DNA methylase